ncbi:MAG: translation initiation factor IF-3 [Planctomycetes bacterium]|nr:translation initiation factor IF-3 [Planctomycetota bacterium]
MSQNKQKVNEEITAPKVRLMGENGDSHGFLTLREAQQIADERNLDLVEVAPDADPPVCRLMDLGKHKYRQKKKLQEQRKKQHTVELKEIWLRPRIDVHDLGVKLNKAKGFLEQGFRVAMTMRFRAREILHKELGIKVLQDVSDELKEHGKVESSPKGDARRMQIIIAPLAHKKGGGKA